MHSSGEPQLSLLQLSTPYVPPKGSREQQAQQAQQGNSKRRPNLPHLLASQN